MKITHRRIAAGVLILLAIYFFICPGLTVVSQIRDPALREPGMPRVAVKLHRSLTPKLERWARTRVASGKAATIGVDNISGTEWPVFSCAFYLWSTQAMQEAWEADPTLTAEAPRAYAKDAIEAAIELLVDPAHGHWVRLHWGDDYLHQENVFYRMLLIGGITAHAELTGSRAHFDMLRDQVTTLVAELTASSSGLLDDYPRECYPSDVAMAVACIARADELLGEDHSAFIKQAVRGFRGHCLTSTGLPPFIANAATGQPIGPARGCSNSYLLTSAPHVWPEDAKLWYDRYETHFWQHKWTASCFREFPKGMSDADWFMDVDSGPVLAGHGFAAGAFGVAAARANGRFDHAYALSTEMIATSWPLPNGTLLAPHLLSDRDHAPLIGESAILFCLTRQPASGVSVRTGSSLPGFVVLTIMLYLAVGFALIAISVRQLARCR